LGNGIYPRLANPSHSRDTCRYAFRKDPGASLLTRRVQRNNEKRRELPLEFMLIAMSFILSALCGITDAYTRRFPNPSDGDLFACIVIISIFLLAIPVNRLNRFSVILFGKLFIAVKQYREFVEQPALPGTEPSLARGGRVLWAMFYCILMTLVLLSAFAISISTLAYVLHLIQ
jgi:hypothetical protein